MKRTLYNHNSDNDEMEVKMWEILTLSVYIEICKYNVQYNNIDSEERNLNGLKAELQNLILKRKDYPCSYLFQFRSNLLDMNKLFDVWYFYICSLYIMCIK